ncbi:MAG: hypothetical protein CVU04_00120 [Bacteroidetes bacterium HGW-Bacteroidetes-20]|nr:MAG: hypothetical protein CVU04_00120 [Bacteroidetes bacterium HGW-Bacteroidetes-20]
MEKNLLLSIAYLPPIEYFYSLATYNAQIEKFEHYQKQSYRNRTIIYAPNGPQSLIIPVIRTKNTPITDVQIDYKTDWQKNHWRSITTAYNNSPFFLYYQDFFESFFSKKTKYLFDFNLELIIQILKILKWDSKLFFTSSFSFQTDPTEDYRSVIHPKNIQSPQYKFNFKNNYNQVFEEKFGFIPFLSIIDLICNQGPNSGSFMFSNISENE